MRINTIEIENEINKVIHEKLFYGIRKMILEKEKEKLVKSFEYKNLQNEDKKEYLNKNYKQWFEDYNAPLKQNQ